MSKLPPIPVHPDPHTYCWTSEEIAAIKEYGQQVHDAAIEQAAKVCDELKNENGDLCEYAAYRIRGLK